MSSSLVVSTPEASLILCMDRDQEPLDTIPINYVEPFTLEPLNSIIQSYRQAGKCFIIARVETLVTLDSGRPISRYFYYAAHHLNKILFRKYGTESTYIFRLYALNPLTNTEMIGNVEYFAVEPAGYSVPTESGATESQVGKKRGKEKKPLTKTQKKEMLEKLMRTSVGERASIKVAEYLQSTEGSGRLDSRKSQEALNHENVQASYCSVKITGTYVTTNDDTKTKIAKSESNLSPHWISNNQQDKHILCNKSISLNCVSDAASSVATSLGVLDDHNVSAKILPSNTSKAYISIESSIDQSNDDIFSTIANMGPDESAIILTCDDGSNESIGGQEEDQESENGEVSVAGTVGPDESQNILSELGSGGSIEYMQRQSAQIGSETRDISSTDASVGGMSSTASFSNRVPSISYRKSGALGPGPMQGFVPSTCVSLDSIRPPHSQGQSNRSSVPSKSLNELPSSRDSLIMNSDSVQKDSHGPHFQTSSRNMSVKQLEDLLHASVTGSMETNLLSTLGLAMSRRSIVSREGSKETSKGTQMSQVQFTRTEKSIRNSVSAPHILHQGSQSELSESDVFDQDDAAFSDIHLYEVDMHVDQTIKVKETGTHLIFSSSSIRSSDYLDLLKASGRYQKPEFRALFVGTDEDFLQNPIMRILFEANALDAAEGALFDIPLSVLEAEGIAIPGVTTVREESNGYTGDSANSEDHVDSVDREDARRSVSQTGIGIANESDTSSFVVHRGTSSEELVNHTYGKTLVRNYMLAHRRTWMTLCLTLMIFLSIVLTVAGRESVVILSVSVVLLCGCAWMLGMNWWVETSAEAERRQLIEMHS